jgi:hypothetical protein
MRTLKVKTGERAEQTQEHTTALLVDEAFAIDQEIKRLNKKLSDMKERLRAIAEDQGTAKLDGHFGEASFQHVTDYEISANDFYDWLLAHKRSNVFRDFVKVDKTKVRAAFGESPLKEGGTERVNLYHKLILKEKK